MIKKLVQLMLVMALAGTAAFAQSSNTANDGRWSQPVVLSSAVQDGPPINLSGLGIAFHEFTWNKIGTLTGGAVELQYAESCTNPTWATLIAAETVTTSGGPTSMEHLSVGCVRFHASTAIAGSGYVILRYNGFINDVTVVGGGGGGGGGGTTQDTDDNAVSAGQDADLMIALGYVHNGSSWVRMTGDATNGLDVDVMRAALITGQTSLAGGNGATSANTLRVTVSNDSTGLLTVQGTGTLAVQCTSGCAGTTATDNSALANLAPIGALYDNTPPAITDGNVGVPRMGSDRILLVAATVQGLAADGAAVSGDPVRIAGKNGSNTQDILTDSSGNLTIVGTGTAGSPATGVVTIQGISSGTVVPVSCSSGCAGGTTDTDDGTVATGQVTGLQIGLNYVFNGSSWKQLTIGTAGTASAQVLTVQGIASMTPLLVTLSGTNNIATVTTVTSATVIGGAADGAAVSGNPVRVAGKDGSGNTQDILTDTSGNQVVVGSGTAGSAAGGVLSVQGVASMMPLQVQSNSANLATQATLALLAVAQGSTTSGQSGTLQQAAVTTANPSYTNGQTSPMNMDTSGNLRTVLGTGSNVAGKFGIDQTTPGTSNLVYIKDSSGASITAVTDQCDGAAKTEDYYATTGTSDNEHQVKGSAGTLCSMIARNAHASTNAYVKCTNATAASTTPGSTAIYFELLVPPGDTKGFVNADIPFSTALTCYVVTGKTAADATDVAADDVTITWLYL